MYPLLPSTNEWDIPDLRPDMQAISIDAPVLPWGSVSRSRHMSGTWSFYVEDYRFRALLKRPLCALESGPSAAVEINWTLYDQTPRAEAMWATYHKRRIARTWQDNGLRVLVDLNVPSRLREICMLGIPKGWRSFATRAYAARPEDLLEEYRFAADWAGGEPLLLVCGGGEAAARRCRELPGAVYVADFMHQRRAVADKGNTAARAMQP